MNSTFDDEDFVFGEDYRRWGYFMNQGIRGITSKYMSPVGAGSSGLAGFELEYIHDSGDFNINMWTNISFQGNPDQVKVSYCTDAMKVSYDEIWDIEINKGSSDEVFASMVLAAISNTESKIGIFTEIRAVNTEIISELLNLSAIHSIFKLLTFTMIINLMYIHFL